MTKLSLKAKNPFGSDIEVFSTKTWIGIGATALVVAIFGGLLVAARTATKRAAGGIQGIHKKLEGTG